MKGGTRGSKKVNCERPYQMNETADLYIEAFNTF